MSLQFVFGPSGSGKSHYLYEKIIKESIKNPGKNYIVIVPEQFTLSTQRELVRLHPRKGIMNIDVLSFARMAYRVFEEVGLKDLPLLDDEGKNLVLRRIAGSCEEELVMLRGNLKKPGYISEIKSVISEFTQYGVTEEDVEGLLEELDEGRLYYKLKDIKVIYHYFKKYLEEKYITKEELLGRLADVVKDAGSIKDSTIVLDGFTGFTPIQNKLIIELLKYSDKLYVSGVIDEKESPYKYEHPYQLFGLTKKMTTTLIELCTQAHIEVEDSITLYEEPPFRFKENPELAFLEENIFRRTVKSYREVPENIHLSKGKTYSEEALEAAAKIRYLIREKKIAPNKIGVVATNMDAYSDYLLQAFESFEIPGFIDRKRSILNNPYIEGVRSFLSMFRDSFSYDGVFRFLKSEMGIFNQEEVEILENYCLGSGVKNFKRWNTNFALGNQNVDMTELELLNELREKFVEFTISYREEFRKNSKTVESITRTLYSFLLAGKMERSLEEKADLFAEEGQGELEKEYRQIYRILIELMDKLVALLGDEVISMEEYVNLLDAGLLEAKVGVIPPGINQVITGDLTRTRFDDIEVLFLVGASDNFLPGNMEAHGILTEYDRRDIEKLKVDLSPGTREKIYTQKLYLYNHLTKPTKQLYISYSEGNAEGGGLNPSYLIEEMKKMFEKIEIADAAQLPIAKREFTKEQAFDFVLKALWSEGEELSDEIKEIIAFFWKHYKKDMEMLLEAHFMFKNMPGITEALAKKLYGEDFMASISRMEKYSNCSYAHFLNYGLKLREREIYEFEAMDLGNICHKALEVYSNLLEEDHLEWVEVSEEQKAAYIDKSIESATKGYKNDIMSSSAKNSYMVEKIRQLVDRSVWTLTYQLAAGDFKPSYFEFGFKDGKIDRIDICEKEDKVYVKVIDYKTGKKELKLSSLYHGLQLQLMIYLDAACSETTKQISDKKIIPSAAMYFYVEDPIVEKSKDAEEVELRKIEALKPTGVVNSDMENITHLDKNLDKKSKVIPVSLKKDGTLFASSHTYEEDELDIMMKYGKDKISKGRKSMLEGEVKAEPFSCDYCPLMDVCGFDLRIKGYEKREEIKADKETLIALMKGELEHGC